MLQDRITSFVFFKVPLQEPHQGDRQAHISRFAQIGTAVSLNDYFIIVAHLFRFALLFPSAFEFL
jgi:hypothetical protein